MYSRTLKSVGRAALIVAGFLIVGCATVPPEARIDNVPMYGQPELPRPEILRKADDDFVAQASAPFGGNREQASESWSKQADEYLANRNLDFAMRRYNQAWLLNPNSFKPYWGFGRVMVERDKFDEAIKHFETAKRLCGDTYQRVALLSDTGTAYSYKANGIAIGQAQERERYFALANDNFAESASLDPSYSGVWRRWAMSLYREGKFAETWQKVERARSMNAAPFPPAFLKALEQKMAEPK